MKAAHRDTITHRAGIRRLLAFVEAQVGLLGSARAADVERLLRGLRAGLDVADAVDDVATAVAAFFHLMRPAHDRLM